MGKLAAAFSFLLFVGLACPLAPAQEKKEAAPQAASNSKVPPEEAKRENPVKPTASSIADGKKLYVTQCAMCHGADGDGKGDLAVDMKLKLLDYRDAASLKDVTDGELRYIMLKGKGDMPDQEGRMKPEQLWSLVNYIRSFAKKSPAAAPVPKKDNPEQ